MQIQCHLYFSVFLHPLTTSSNAPSCGSQINILPLTKPIWQGERYNHDRIRVAYLSADFREHASVISNGGNV